MSESDTRQTFDEILSLHELDKSDLEDSRPTEAVRNKFAVRLKSWEDCQRLCTVGFRFPNAAVATIARENKQESERKIAVMRAWRARRKRSATYLNLAQALYRAEFDELVQQLCKKFKEQKLLVTSDSIGSEESDETGQYSRQSSSFSSQYSFTSQASTLSSQYSRQASSLCAQSSIQSVNGSDPECLNQEEIKVDFDAQSSVADNKLTDPECPSEQDVAANGVYAESSVTDNKLTGVNHDSKSTADESEVNLLPSESSSSESSLPSGKMTENQLSTLCFSETMSTEAFHTYLQKEGLPPKDCETLKLNGFGAKMFVNGFGDTEIENTRLNFTLGGKLLLKRLVKEHSQKVVIGHLTIKKDKLLGSGAFGSVFKGTWKQKPCAVKVLRHLGQEVMTDLPTATEGKGHEEALLRFEKECQFMKEYDHPNIVCCYDTLIYPKCNLPILVMELMDANLCKFIGDHPDIALEIQISLCRNVASALTFLHCKGLVHRDLCGDNILLNCCQEGPVAKISDFGMSRVIIKCHGSLTHSITALGRRGFIPPEGPLNYDSSLDIFMFGVVMITIADNMPRIEDRQQRQKCLKKIPNHHPLKRIICRCTSEKKEERPTTAEVYDILMKTKASESVENDILEFHIDKGSLTKLIGETVIRSSDLAEVPVTTLEKRGSVVGLFFSAHWCPPSRTFTPQLISWYNDFERRSNGHLLNIVFISSDASEGEFHSYFQAMPWYSLHYNHLEKKDELGAKFNVNSIPSLVFVDGKTGKLITREGREIVLSDPHGNKFPWRPPSLSEVIADCKFIGRDQEQTWGQLKEQVIGFFFSAPSSRHRSFKAFSNELAMVYQKLKENGKKFEIIYVNVDKDETAWKEYVENMPWLALPFGDKHAMDLVSAADVTIIPALIILDENEDVITRGGCSSVRSDSLGSAFPWYVNYLTEDTADEIPATPSLIWFIPNELKHTAKEILEQIAKRYLSKCAEVKADVNLQFFLSCRGRDYDKIVDVVRSIATLPDIEPLLIILDISKGKVHICDSYEVTIDCAKKFVSDYFQKRLIGKGLVPMTVTQRRHIEADVLKSCLEGVSAAMMVQVDANLFGTLLVQYGFASETALSTSMYSPEIPSKLRIAAILQIVESTIREAPSSRKARELFNLLVEVIAEPLGCMDIAQILVTMCKMKDPTYVSPIKIPAKAEEDTCPRDHDAQPVTKTGYDFDVKNQHLSLIKFVDAGETKKVKVYDETAPKWKILGGILGLEHFELDSIQHDCEDDRDKATAVLKKWMENANNLASGKYPMTWTGLVNLLKDCELGTLSETVDKALKANVNSVKGNMS